MTVPALTAQGKRLSRVVERRSNASLVVTRPHSLTDRDTATPVGTLRLSGAHSTGVTALTLEASDGGALRGTVPKGIVLTIDAVEYTVQAGATAASNALVVTVSPGLGGNKADEKSVTVAPNVAYAYAKAVARPANDSEQVHAQSFGREISYILSVPARGATTWIESGDLVQATMTNGYVVPLERVDSVQTVTWGQKVFG